MDPICHFHKNQRILGPHNFSGPNKIRDYVHVSKIPNRNDIISTATVRLCLCSLFQFLMKALQTFRLSKKKRKRKGATVITHFMFLFYCESEIDQRSLVFLDMVSAAYVCQTLFVQGLLGRKLQFSDHILKFVPVSTRLLFVFSCNVL